MNPARLQPALREAVCQQCHLQGDIRVVRAGRSLTDYRPGLPLSSIESVFVKAENARQVPILRPGRADVREPLLPREPGKMGCISCHDPHEVPDPSEKATYYRDRCLNCHAEKGCSLPKPERLSRGRDDRCIDCHMPRSPNEQVPHTATTLHLIPRFKDRTEPVADLRRQSSGRDAPLIHFHRDQLDPGERSEVARDLGIALATNSRAIPGMTAGAVSRMALPLLETSLKADPADGPAWEAKGTVLWQLGRREESLSAFRTALATSPNREETLVAAGTRAAQLGKREEALDDFGRAIAINPWRADYHQVVALLHSERQEWNAAIEAARDSLRLNPSNHEARMLLIQCLLRNAETGRKHGASSRSSSTTTHPAVTRSRPGSRRASHLDARPSFPCSAWERFGRPGKALVPMLRVGTVSVPLRGVLDLNPGGCFRPIGPPGSRVITKLQAAADPPGQRTSFACRMFRQALYFTLQSMVRFYFTILPGPGEPPWMNC